MAQAKALRGADGELLPRRLLPDVIGWLTPRCAAVVRVVAAVERRRAFVEERLPIWEYVWAGAHGHMHAEVIRGNDTSRAVASTIGTSLRRRASNAVPARIERLASALTNSACSYCESGGLVQSEVIRGN